MCHISADFTELALETMGESHELNIELEAFIQVPRALAF